MNSERWELYHLLVGLGLKNRNGWFNILANRMHFTEDEIKEIGQYEDDMIDENKRLEKISDDYYKAKFKEWKDDKENAETLKEIYRDKLNEYVEDYIGLCKMNFENRKYGMMPFWLRQWILRIRGIDRIEKNIRKFKMLCRIADGTWQGQINPDMIVRAREYPIENIIEPKRGYIVCPYHEDHAPSMWVKNNFGYCFSCGAHADAIDLMQKLNGLNFIEAVRRMQ